MTAPVNRLKKALLTGKQTVGCWLTLGDDYAAEITARAGFDWCLIDREHALNVVRSTLAQLQAIATTPTNVVVRPAVGDPHLLKQLLDIGSQSFVVPMVESAA
jgi:4-hydroxy-2-oxoheptanedioate aldolase